MNWKYILNKLTNLRVFQTFEKYYEAAKEMDEIKQTQRDSLIEFIGWFFVTIVVLLVIFAILSFKKIENGKRSNREAHNLCRCAITV